MKLEEMKRIAAKRTPVFGGWKVYHWESDWETASVLTANGGVICKMSHYGKMREDAEFIAMAANNYDKLLAVVEAAKNLSEYILANRTKFPQPLSRELIPLKKALDELEKP